MIFKIFGKFFLDSKGTKQAEAQTRAMANNVERAADEADILNKKLTQTKTAQTAMGAAGVTSSQYKQAGGVIGRRGATGKNFSALAQTTGGGGPGSLVGAYAEVAANIFALTAAFSALSRAAQVEQLTQGLELMGARGGVALKSTAEGLREVTDNAISVADSFKVVAQASSAGLGTEEIQRLGGVARGASLALGRDMSEAMDRLTRGAIKLEPELLDELGIMVRLDEAVREFALQNDKTVTSLTAAERRQAFLNAVLEEGERKFGDISEQIAANPYDKLSASVRDLATTITKFINVPLKLLASLFADNPFLLFIPGIFLLQKAFKGLGISVQVEMTKIDDIMTEELGGLAETLAKHPIADQIFQNAAPTNRKELAQAFDDILMHVDGVAAAEIRLAKKNAMAATSFMGVRAAARSAAAALKTMSVAVKSLLKAMAPMLLLTLAFAAIGFLFKEAQRLYRIVQGINKEVIEARKGFVDVTASATKTLEESRRMGAAEAADARMNAMKSLMDANDKLLEGYRGGNVEQLKSVELLKNTKVAVQGLFRTREKSLETILKDRKVNKDVRNGIAAQLQLLKEIAPEREAEVLEAIKKAKTEEQVVEIMQQQLQDLEEMTGRFKEINSLAIEMSKNLKEVLPKSFENGTTKVLENFAGITREINSGANSAQGLGAQLRTIGADQIRAASALVNLYSGQEAIFTQTIAKLKEIQRLEAEIAELRKGGFLSQLKALHIRAQIEGQLQAELGETAAAESKQAQKSAEIATQVLAQLEAQRALIQAKVKQVGLEKKVLELNNKITASRMKGELAQIGGKGPEAGIVSSILNQTAALSANAATIDARLQLLDEEAAAEKRRLEEQKAVADVGVALTTYQREQNLAIAESIGLVDTQTQLKKDAILLEQTLAQEEIRNLQTKLQSLASGTEARREELKQLEQVLNFEKQIASERQKGAQLRLAGQKQAAEILAGPRGLTQAQQNEFQRRELQLQIDAFDTQMEMLRREEQMKLDVLMFEHDIRKMELSYLKERIASDPNLNPAVKSELTGNIDTIQQRAVDNFATAALQIIDLNAIQRENLQLQQENAEALKDSIPTTLEDRFRLAAQGAMPQAQIAGLSGAALAFAQDELRGATSDDERDRILDMAYALEESIIAAEGFNNVMNTVQSSMEEAFMSLIDGSKSAKEAFADMAKAILAEIAKIIVKLLVVRALQAIGLPIPAFEYGGVIPMANGGYMGGGRPVNRARSSFPGGIIDKPTYLVGEGRYNEAVVPLPNGRAIPVQMSGGGSQQNNVAVTVNMTDSGTSTQTEGRDPAKLGQVIAAAVQKELMAQKSPGGLLSKYG